MTPERLSENTMHFWYLFHARDERIKSVEKIQERYGVGAIEPVSASSPPRGVNRNYNDSLIPRAMAQSKRTVYRNNRISKPEQIQISDPDLGFHVDTFA